MFLFYNTHLKWNDNSILLSKNHGVYCSTGDSFIISWLKIIAVLDSYNAIPFHPSKTIISKCKQDANFVVRMVCDEVEKGVAEE